MKGFVKFGFIKMGVLTNALWHSLFQENTTSFFVNSKNGIVILEYPFNIDFTLHQNAF
jgi:hypothetical protein